MGIRRALRLVREADYLGVAQTGTTARRPSPAIRSPFTQGQLTSIVWADVIGEDLQVMTRAEAMAVPAMSRARHIICGFGARAPLRQMTGDQLAPNQAPWLYRSDSVSQLPPYHRMVWTLDDVLFTGWSLWAIDRYSETNGGHVRDAARVPREWWTFDDNGKVEIDDQPIPYSELILIPGPHEGVLNFARRTLRIATRLENATANAAEAPVPTMELHDEGDTPLEDDEITQMLTKWAAARRGANGGVGYTNKSVKAIAHGAHPENLMIQGRNASAVDVARHASLPAASIDATMDKGSLTYETTEGRNKELIDYGIQMYWDAVAARLSMDDVVPRGDRIAFDAESITAAAAPPTGSHQED